MAPRCGDHSTFAGLRLRRLISFLRHRHLYLTAHALERETGVFFDAAHLRRMLLHDRWAAASCYALRFLNVGDCSSAGDMLRRRLIVFRVIADYAAGRRTCAVDALFQGFYDSLHRHPKCHPHRRVLLSLRSDHSNALRLYRSTKSKAVEDIMYLVARCPELKAKAQLPHCSFNSKFIVSLGLWLLGCPMRHRNKPGRTPAHVLVRSFLRKRDPPINHKAKHLGVPCAPFLQSTPAMSPKELMLF